MENEAGSQLKNGYSWAGCNVCTRGPSIDVHYTVRVTVMTEGFGFPKIAEVLLGK